MLETFALPMMMFVTLPPLAFGPALLLGLCFDRHRAGLGGWRQTAVLAGIVAWLAYAVYECAMWIWAREIIAPIRLDLALIAPPLAAVTAAATWSCLRSIATGPPGPPGGAPGPGGPDPS